MQRGIIKFINYEKGFGFIQAEHGPDVFFHAKQRDFDEQDEPRFGIPIFYDEQPGPKGPVACGWRFTPRPEVVIDPEQDRQEGFRPGVLIRYRWCGQILLGSRRSLWTWLRASIDDKLEEHGRSPEWMYSYGVPQGGIEAGETCEQAIRRELVEELGDYGNFGWTHDLKIRFLFKERAPFRFQKDGRSWGGKVLYAFDVVGQVPDELCDWLLGNNRDELDGTPLPTSAFEGGIKFYRQDEALLLIQQTQHGPKGAQLMRLLKAV